MSKPTGKLLFALNSIVALEKKIDELEAEVVELKADLSASITIREQVDRQLTRTQRLLAAALEKE